MDLVIKKEIKKYLVIGFIVPIDYSPWTSNIITMPKTNVEVRCCMDFKDTNKACPKDIITLLNIDMIVDSTSNHDIFSFMDGFFEYNQIIINQEDQHKITFVTP